MTRVCVIADRYVILFLSFFDQSLVFLLHVRITDVTYVIALFGTLSSKFKKVALTSFFFV